MRSPARTLLFLLLAFGANPGILSQNAVRLDQTQGSNLRWPTHWNTSRLDRWFDAPLSNRTVHYKIQASLDWKAKTLKGKAHIQWKNPGSEPSSELPLHLYLNAFKGPQTLFMKDWLRSHPTSFKQRDPQNWGYCRLLSARAGDQILPGRVGEDETVHWLKLPHPVKPGESLNLELTWEVQFPRLHARSGWSEGFLMGAQWFPKIGVYRGQSWICHPYRSFTEFFSDFGVYDVELSVPKSIILAHTGTLTNARHAKDVLVDPSDPDKYIWKMHAEDVHDFAWAAMPKLTWGEPICIPYRGVQVFYHLAPNHRTHRKRQLVAIQSALRSAGEWFAPYPYPVLSVVDVPEGAEGADGMEYPTLITSSLPIFDPLNLRITPELVAIHEYGHQYFQGMLASDEVLEPWLDEGFATWFTARVMQQQDLPPFGSRRFNVRPLTLEWIHYMSDPSLDPIVTQGPKFLHEWHYLRSSYSKAALALNQLEALLGRRMMEMVLRSYVQEMAFKHPTAKDFLRIAEKVSGRDLKGFWRDWIEGTGTLDYIIQDVEALDTSSGGYRESHPHMNFVPPQPTGRRASIVLRRRGDIMAPVTLWVQLENGEERRETWDGQTRWTRLDFDQPIRSAVLDPDGNYPMLKDRLHASWTWKPRQRGFHYWAQLTWGSLTALLQSIGIG